LTRKPIDGLRSSLPLAPARSLVAREAVQLCAAVENKLEVAEGDAKFRAMLER
jgi:hypothetical protein